MIKAHNLKLYLLLFFIGCSFVSQAAFVVPQDSSVLTDNFLLLTPIKPSLSDRLGLRTKGHLMINEDDRIVYQLKEGRGSKRGQIIRILNDEVQVYNQVTGKVDFIPVENIESIRRTYNWKAWIGLFTGSIGAYLLMVSFFAFLIGLIGFLSVRINTANGGNGGLLLGSGEAATLYGFLFTISGSSLFYAARNILYKFKKFRIGKKFKIGIYSMEQKNK